MWLTHANNAKQFSLWLTPVACKLQRSSSVMLVIPIKSLRTTIYSWTWGRLWIIYGLHCELLAHFWCTRITKKAAIATSDGTIITIEFTARAMELAFANCTTVHFSKRSIWVQALIIGSTTMHLKNIFGSNHSPNMSFIHEREEFSNVASLVTKNGYFWAKHKTEWHRQDKFRVVIRPGPLQDVHNQHITITIPIPPLHVAKFYYVIQCWFEFHWHLEIWHT